MSNCDATFFEYVTARERVAAERIVPLLREQTRHSDIVLFSAAPPGQGGHGHVNERSYEYWRGEFAGVMTGLPSYQGKVSLLRSPAASTGG